MAEQDLLKKQLKFYFGYEDFREGQREMIEEVMNGNDVLGVLPTGTGKSLCYQLSAKILHGTTIIISPLISLMMDQVNQLKADHFKKVAAINSFMNPKERWQIYRNLFLYDLIYVSPELIQQEELLSRLRQIPIPLFVVDEAHCISQWGHEFRPDYLKLNAVIKQLGHPVVMALSATASKDVQEDIIAYLDRPAMVKHIFPMDRENIILSVKQIDNDAEKTDVLIRLFSRHPLPGIIYFSSRLSAEETAGILREKLPGLRIAFYHGGMEQMDRISIQQQFMHDQLDIICCTSAFGMGINKSNIRFVIHYHLPPQLESYIQEIGRAGRDGRQSLALLLYSPKDRWIPQSFIEKELPSNRQLEVVFQQLKSLKENARSVTVTEEFAEMLQLHEIQWRFLYYQLEKHGMIVHNKLIDDKAIWKTTFLQVQQLIDERIRMKERELKEMLNWIEEESCLREHLYTHFQDAYTVPETYCCSNCGYSLTVFQGMRCESRNTESQSWQTKLRHLLLPEVHDETTT